MFVGFCSVRLIHMEIVEEKRVNAEKSNVDLLSTSDQSRPNRSFSKPSWLLLTIAGTYSSPTSFFFLFF